MEKTIKLLKIASKSNIPVLLQGESGAGKEVAARTLHKNSHRSGGPFIALNCGAIPASLAESTLEGSQKGAYTGASAEQIGIVRAAHGGTLFLDEIGEMPFEMQSRLLRVLQERAVRPVGATESISVDFRLVCATNRDLKAEVARGRFRQDLFYRLNAFPVTLPPLRERSDFGNIANDVWQNILRDMPELQAGGPAHSTLSEENSHSALSEENSPPALSDNKSHLALSEDEIRELKKRSWPGNVRQLKNVLQRYALLKPHGYSLPGILDEEFSEPFFCEPKQTYTARYSATPLPFADSMAIPIAKAPSLEWEAIQHAIAKCGGNKSRAAEILGISRGCLCYRLKMHESPQKNGQA